MRAPLSVIIPTLNAEQALPACLGALYAGVSAGILRELIVVDGGSEDQTLAIADEVGAKIIRTTPSRGGQLRQGGELATGEWLLFVHADTVLSESWVEAVEAKLGQSDKAGWFTLAFDTPGPAGRVVAGWANLRSRVFGLPYGDQALLISRRLYGQVGGYDDIPLMEDVALARRLGRKRLMYLDAVATTSAEKYRKQGWLRRGRRNLLTLLRYFLGAKPETLAASYRKGG
ncbi:TIGR04283 family arsenosugar biosynthesis glycosyltransferase [Shimia sp. MMG029]|uniref:TIGR04283 family arsenosugar biosynthesis glycosyltransferase n=1 Tax=Shimia sp. MMG029 TaxID=3021978 RepID=UPI0022FDB3B1|nr:TIGR04283 family arsenosugar biosynthesis glycosyltransferase [Shimia sp. MMG029]MDA5558118.1 TIGR04283 family arsenosugar biosynthesis glycosyltransferase [Shimia sp. MMG029]